MNQPRQSWLPTGDEPLTMASPAKILDDTIALVQDTVDVIKDGIEEDPAMVYEALDQTFKWRDRYREKLENANNELSRKFILSFFYNGGRNQERLLNILPICVSLLFRSQETG